MTAGKLSHWMFCLPYWMFLFTFNVNFLCNLQNGKSHGLEIGDTNSSLAQQLDQTIQLSVPWLTGDLGLFKYYEISYISNKTKNQGIHSHLNRKKYISTADRSINGLNIICI